MKEDEHMFVAYSPSLDLSTQGESIDEAKKMFKEAAEMFIEDLIERNTLDAYLSQQGWKKLDGKFLPPHEIVSEESTDLELTHA